MKLDWQLLAIQKEWLVNEATARAANSDSEAVQMLDGLTNLLDTLQDDAVTNGDATLVEVFGMPDDDGLHFGLTAMVA